ncbi:glycoside hydrolase family 15 protein [Saccharothrix xinjiangensis]|uniref:Glycoside hydrolase family 15 protein n=1 Tax=Saccharothrix xinjiangensis TaxID=204798 RepID=A0ABV9Y1Q6_9PSEU
MTPPLVAVLLASALTVPGPPATYMPADKQGFGTARQAGSPVWFTLGRGGLNEVFYPDLSTPATRELKLVVNGRTATNARTEQVGRLRYRQVFGGPGWQARVTYTTDPSRATVLADVEVEGERVDVRVVFDPNLSRDGDDDIAVDQPDALVARDRLAASALVADHGVTPVSATTGNVVQTGELRLRHGRTTLAMGFGANPEEALTTARASLIEGFPRHARRYDQGWDDYLKDFERPRAADRDLYETSLMVLAAAEDKRNPGAFIASPSFPWAFGFDREVAPEFGSYALVWPRDQYQIAGALLAAGDTRAAHRALDFMLDVQQRPDGHLPQNTRVTGEPHWTNVQLDEQAAPALLAWLLGRADRDTLDGLVRAAEFMVSQPNAPFTEQERWENQGGYSPGTIASAIAGLVCLADLLQRAGDPRAARFLAIADDWEARVEGWTVTRTGPFSDRPYYLRLTKDGQPDRGTTYNPGDNHPTEIDQRAAVDPSFLELVRLGVRPHDDPVVRNTVRVVDEQLKRGRFWHRYNGDGFGERADGGPWNIGHGRTYGRTWPIFAGERGEYELLAGDPGAARGRLADVASAANAGRMLPEQVWRGRGTTSATPLSWTHAQYVRLAWSIEAGEPVERPAVVACRYAERC